MTPAELVARHKHILLDFDGPVCAVFGGEISDLAAADELRALLGADLPHDIAVSRDPFDVLRYAYTLDAATAATVEARFRGLELDAVTTAPETPGARTAIESLVEAGHIIAIVSNNSAGAVRHYLELHRLSTVIAHVSAREAPNVERLKPAPFLLNQAICALDTRPSTCVMIGDSETDVDASLAAGTAVIGYANKSGKVDRLKRRGAEVLVNELFELLMVVPRHDAT